MARARNIKPKFFENEILGGLDPLARLLFIGMWTIADFKGCFEYRPVRMKAQLLPYDDCNINALVDALEKAKFIVFYKIEGKEYVKILTFVQHQNPHKNERDSGSDVPDYDEKYRQINELEKVPKKSDVSPKKSEPLALIPDSLLLIPDSGFLNPDTSKTDDFEHFWRLYPKRPGANKAKAFKQWIARLKEGCDVEDILVGAENYREYCKAENSESKFILHPATFIGPDHHYLADWTQGIKRSANQEFVANLIGKGHGDEFEWGAE